MADAPRAGRWVAELLTAYELPLLRYAHSLLGDADAARDVVQETFLRLIRDGDDASRNGHAAAWLFTVCRNRAMDVRRKERRMIATADPVQLDRPCPADEPHASAESDESQAMVRQWLTTLPDNQQQVVRLKFQAGLSYREIAAATGMSVTHVGVMLHTAIKMLRARMNA